MTEGRFLITTSDERSWKSDRPVLFLGEWCKLYNRKFIWDKLDAAVAKPFCISVEEKDRSLIYTQGLRKQLLLELTDRLNSVHGTKHSSRYWNILIGRWLFRYVDIFFNRYYNIEQVLKNYPISSTAALESKYSLVTEDSLTFIYAAGDPLWNHVLYLKVLDFLTDGKIKKDNFGIPEIQKYEKDFIPPGKGKSSLKRAVVDLVFNFLQKLKRNKDAVIINSYLPKKDELKMQLLLGQCPQLWSTPSLLKVRTDPDLRDKLKLDLSGFSGFELFIRQQLVEALPICYLEGYKGLVDKSLELPWPTEPKYIFTSNMFDTDEVFKHWTGVKVESGVPYFIGQHGNNYGTVKGYSEWPEFVTPDLFITWGWNNGNSKYIPAFNFKIVGRKTHRYNKNGGLLLVELYVPHRVVPWDDYYEFVIYQEEQFEFAKALPPQIHEHLTVRLHAQHVNHDWFEEMRWADSSPKTKLERGQVRINDLIANSRLIVHSYDSTGILETLALNIPTICFWQNGFDHLIPEAKPYYQHLKEAGIIADGPREAAEFVAKNWDNIEEWWNSDKVQNARQIFCDNYSRIEKRPLRKMKKLLNECAESCL